jgi:hypothetical protein
MNNNLVTLGTGSSLRLDSVSNDVVLAYPQTQQLILQENVTGVASVFSPTGIKSGAFGTDANDSAAAIVVPTATPTVIFTIPLTGGGNKYQKMWRILVGYTDGATNYQCSYVDVGVFWNGTTSAHYVVAGASTLPVGWSLTVPVMSTGAVEFTHTFGSDLDVYVSYIIMGQNI